MAKVTITFEDTGYERVTTTVVMDPPLADGDVLTAAQETALRALEETLPDEDVSP